MNKILVHNNWDPLEEIWLGDVWPSHFYDDIKDSAVRDAWYQVTEWTKEDLANLQKKLEEFNVVVRRPYVDGPKELYTDKDQGAPTYGKLLKPPITPRDCNAVIGDNLYFSDGQLINCYRPLLDSYDQNYVKSSNNINKIPFVSGANIVKLGQDIIFDREHHAVIKRGSKVETQDLKNSIFEDFYNFSQREIESFSQDYRMIYTANGGHADGCFMPVKPGLLLATGYWNDYDVFFPGWQTLNLSSPTYAHFTKGQRNSGRWMVPGLNAPPHFNEYIEKYCPEWIGNFTETIFEVNMVMIDENNMLCSGEHPTLFKALEHHGVTPHIVPFRCRTFWDGNIHCITLDIRRRAEKKDYFPERGANGLHMVRSELFDNNTEKFMSEYQQWLETTGRN